MTKPINRDLLQNILKEENHLSSHSKFYCYNNKIYNFSYYSLSEVTGVKKVEKLIKKFKIQKEQQKQIDILTLRNMYSNFIFFTPQNLINRGLYKYRVPERVKIEEVRRTIYPTANELVNRCNIINKQTHQSLFLTPVFDKGTNSIGFFYDCDMYHLSTFGCYLYLIDFKNFQQYMNDNGIDIPDIQEDKKVTRFELLDFKNA